MCNMDEFQANLRRWTTLADREILFVVLSMQMPRVNLPRLPADQEETRRIAELLRTMLRVLPISNREVERRLNFNVGYLSRLFSGAIELKYEQIVAICRVVGLKPGEFFSLAYSGAESDPELVRRLAKSIAARTGQLPPRLPAPSATKDSPPELPTIEEQVQQAMAKFFASLAVAAGHGSSEPGRKKA